MTATTLLLRNGQPAATPVHTDSNGKPFTLLPRPCGRCGGAGGSEAWRHTGWTCYDCGGNGRHKNGPERAPLYTADRLAKLDATQAKLNARRAAKHAAAEAERQAATDARRNAFEATHADVLPWLRAAATEPEGFLADMLRLATSRCEWTPAQSAAIRKVKAARDAQTAKRAASTWVGQIGERIATTVTVERIHEFARPRFNASWLTETVYIVTMRDENGNALVSKSTAFAPPEGATLAIKATVKDHSEFRGERQTTLTRVTDVAADQARKTATKARKLANTPVQAAA